MTLARAEGARDALIPRLQQLLRHIFAQASPAKRSVFASPIYRVHGIAPESNFWFHTGWEDPHASQKSFSRVGMPVGGTGNTRGTARRSSPQDARYYDRAHKDYHNWDDHENQAWHHFLVENHRQEHEFAKANRKEQAEYWNWRHNHPD